MSWGIGSLMLRSLISSLGKINIQLIISDSGCSSSMLSVQSWCSFAGRQSSPPYYSVFALAKMSGLWLVRGRMLITYFWHAPYIGVISYVFWDPCWTPSLDDEFDMGYCLSASYRHRIFTYGALCRFFFFFISLFCLVKTSLAITTRPDVCTVAIVTKILPGVTQINFLI